MAGGIVMPYVGFVPNDIIGRVAESIRQILPLLETGVLYEAPELCSLCSPPLTPNQQKLAGRCVRYLVETKQVPLVLAGKRSNQHLVYRLEASSAS